MYPTNGYGNGNHNRLTRQYIEELEAYKASFGFSAEEEEANEKTKRTDDKYRKAYVRKGKRGGIREVDEQLYSNLEGDFEKSNLEDDVEEVEKGVKTLA
ncbi:hypothetical protein DY000_02020684 [Brassica cretica]|uniref:Uncharacterized protein n=1 Tax=Brassica cretica TaxID=69181 RepID=A0ABQ7EFE6_BRACR|nr:hypothetical protein DY000_02020684 [Brassica cretica]